MDEWLPLGKHRMCIDGDVVFARTAGPITGKEVIELLEHLRVVERQYGYVLEVIDARGGGSMDPEARRLNAEWHRAHPMHLEAVVFGASLVMRGLMIIMANAFRLVGSKRITVHFVATESDAMAWVEVRRRALQAAKLGREQS